MFYFDSAKHFYLYMQIIINQLSCFMNTPLYPIIIALFFCLFIVHACTAAKKNTQTQVPKIQTCPEAWYINMMPSISQPDSATPNQYLIINAKRVEVADVDTIWIRKNCKIKQASPIY
jgi:hypothetical protein